MQYCVIYKTRNKEGLYLFVKEKNQFDAVPGALMQQFGTPELVMVLPLKSDKVPVRVSKAVLIEKLQQDGYYLQLPPQSENLLETHREGLGLDPKPPIKDM